MITVNRGDVQPPEWLFSARVAQARDSAAAHFRASDARARQNDHRFIAVSTAPEVLDRLTTLFSNKCAFCETALGGSVSGDAHHFRPRRGALDPRSGDTSRRHYWWLAYEWENLYLACSGCARAAGPRFPVAGQRARGGATGDDLRRERPLLLDPCFDDATEALLFQLEGSVEPGDERGAHTIDTFALNRPSLVAARKARIRQVEALLQRDGPAWGEVCADDAPFAGMVRQLFGALLPGQPHRIAAARPSSPRLRDARSPLVRIVAARILNFRSIEELELTFQAEPDSWTMILGENGEGKTSVLQALAVALMTGAKRSRVDSATYLRHGARNGAITVELSDGSTRHVEFSSDDRRFRSSSASRLVLAGYGAYRAPGRGTPLRSSTPHVGSLMNPYARLISPTEWLLQIDRRTFDAAAGALKRLLLDDEGFFQRRKGRVIYQGDDGPVTLDNLSAGYRSTVALGVDLMSYMLTQWGDLRAAEGIVLIDELGTHLHPRWQMKVVSAFRQTFPRVQFVATTHDPLCLRGLRRGEAIVLRRDLQRRIFAVDNLPHLDNMFVDQLLTSEYFGLGSTLDPELEIQFSEYYALLSVREPSTDQRNRLEELRAILTGRGQLGTTERERLVLGVADRALAQRAVEANEDSRERLTAEAEAAIADIWLEMEA